MGGEFEVPMLLDVADPPELKQVEEKAEAA
jgi:hypothetical protein